MSVCESYETMILPRNNNNSKFINKSDDVFQV